MNNNNKQNTLIAPKFHKHYYLTIDRLFRKNYLLKVIIEDENVPFHVALFTNGVLEEAYTELFEQIRYRNKLINHDAFLHIPKDWYNEDYEELLDIFNAGYLDVKLTRDGITLVNKIFIPLTSSAMRRMDLFLFSTEIKVIKNVSV